MAKPPAPKKRRVSKTKDPRKARAPSKSGFGTVELHPYLAEILGETNLPRTQVTKKIWEYIKDHDLQDPSDRRYIICDDRLREIFNQDRISAFKIQGPLSKVRILVLLLLVLL